MNRAAFYAALRRRDSGIFGTSLTQGQVRGMDAILDEAEARGTPPRHLAYILATPYHETGAKMLPVRESLNYSVDGLLKTFGRHRISEADARKYGRTGNRPANQQMIANLIYGGAWGREHLGNTEYGDGWRYRAGDLVGITGRSNYTKFGIASDPDRAGDLLPAVRRMFDGMERGIYTGRRLSEFTDYAPMRQVINGTDKALTIAGYARAFERALVAAGYAARPSPVGVSAVKTEAATAGEKTGVGGKVSIIAIAAAAVTYWWADLSERVAHWISQLFGG
jgi:putative chitinase